MLTLSNPPGVAAPLGAYSHVVKVPANTELLFISGQVGVRPDGTTPDNLADQADQVFANIVGCLRGHGLNAEHIVKLTTFIVAGHDVQVVRKARLKYMGDHKPASTAIFISQLVEPKWFLEVEAVAARPA